MLSPRGIRRSLAVAVLVLALASCGDGDEVTTGSGAQPTPDALSGGPSGSLPPDAVRYAVTGTVRDAAGRPVPGVMVSAVSLDRPAQPVPELAVLSDAAGHYGWPSLKPGRYELRVRAAGGSAAVRAIVPDGGGATADLTLRASPEREW